MRTRQSPTRRRHSSRPVSLTTSPTGGSPTRRSSASRMRRRTGGAIWRRSRRARVGTRRASLRSTELAADLVHRDSLAAPVLLPRLVGAGVLIGRGGLVVLRRVLERDDQRVALTSAGDDFEHLLGFELGEFLDGLAELVLGGHGPGRVPMRGSG